jgi:hypothetical protein
MGKKNRDRRKQKLARKAARRSRRLEKKKTLKTKTIAPKLYQHPNPLEHLAEDERRLAIAEISKASEAKYQESLAALRELFAQYDARLLISSVTAHGLSQYVSENTGVTKSDSDFEIYQYHVEILQALSLQVSPDEMGGALFGPDVTQRAWTTIQELTTSMEFRQLNPNGIDLPNDRKTIALVQSLMRGATRAVRNWGFHSQVKRISRELYSPFDEQLIKLQGYSVSILISVFEAMIVEIEARMNARLKALSSLFRESHKNPTRLVEKYHELIGQSEEEAIEFVENFDVKNAPLKDVKHLILSHSDLRLPEIYSFRPRDLADRTRIDEATVQKILSNHSLEWGELADYDTEHIYLSNPIWIKPAIRVHSDEYFCAIPACFFSFVIPAIESHLSSLQSEVSDRRASYLESKVANVLRRHFPAPNIRSNVTWALGGTRYETDIIATIDSFALIIECKSGRVSPPALRGAPDRLRRHIQELLIDPNLQSLRLKGHLEHLCQNPDVTDPLWKELGNL